MNKTVTLIVSIMWCITSYGQNINLALKNATIETFVKAVQKQTDKTFVYGEDVQFDYAINIEVKNAELKSVLKDVLTPHNIEFTIGKRHITLIKKKSTETGTDGSIKQTSHTINGYIKDRDSKETLIGATAYATDEKRGTVSNAYGFFSLTLQGDKNRLNFSYIGYAPQTIDFSLAGDTTIIVEMVGNNEIEEVTIEADRPETGTASSRTGATTIPIETIQKQPALLGEPDVLKTLQTLPGVQRGLAGTSSIHVRGGGPDQNLYLLDGVPMYNIDHVMGFISAFTPDAVKHVEFYKASFPARYGGRLSSVIDVRTKDGNMQEWHGMGQIGTLSSHMSVEGPINKDKTSLIVSARRTYFDLIASPIMKMDDEGLKSFKMNFYDVNAKINHIFSDKDRLYGSFYIGRDIFGFESENDEGSSWKDNYSMDLRWGNTLGSVRWNHVFTPQLFSNMTLAYNKFNFGVDIDDKSQYENTKDHTNSSYDSGIDDMTATIDFDYHPTHAHHIKYGGLYIRHIFRPSISTAYISTTKDGETNRDTYKNDDGKTTGNEFDVYAEDDMTLGDKWQMNAGAHVTFFAVDGKTYINVEPRFSAAYIFSQGWRAKASYTTMHQYVHLLQTAPISLPSDLWVPIDKDIKPMFSQQISLGVSYSTTNAWEFTAETYYKEMKHILDYKDGASFSGTSSGWQTMVSEGKGYSRGIELMARKIVGNTTGSLSYTLAKSDRQYDANVSAGKKFPYKYDRRNVLNISLIHKFSDRIDIAASWSFMSGSWATVAKQRTTYMYPTDDYSDDVDIHRRNGLENYYNNNEDRDYYDRRNNYHLKPSHQLDLSVNFHKKLKHCERTLNISVINAYNKKNQDIVYTSRKSTFATRRITDENGYTYEEKYETGRKTVLNQISIVPIIPSISYTIHF